MSRGRDAAHEHDGWTFRRGTDGSVTIWAGDDRELVLTAAAWIRIVTAVSAGGRLAYRQAQALHRGATDGRPGR